MQRFLHKLTSRGNWFWVLVYGAIFAYLIARLLWLPPVTPDHSQCLTQAAASWLNFKQAVTLPLAILLGAIFVHMFSNPIESPATEGLHDQEKTAMLARAQQAQSLQRRNWMIFAYSFMLVALLVPIYLFGPGWDAGKVLSLERSNDLNNPVSIFVGCSKGQQKGELGCPAQTPQNVRTTGEPTANPDKPASGVSATAPLQPDKSANSPGGAWVLNLGGHVTNSGVCKLHDASGSVCEVQGGLLVPIYVIILALIGGGISLTRRLPEYQKRAHPEFISTDKESRLNQHEFREYLVFQMVQFISAPLLAILAYFLVDPSSAVSSVVLAFSAGFASESILVMVRALTEKFTPSGDAPAHGTLSGVVTHADATGNPAPLKGVEVVLASSTQLRAVSDDAGFYVLSNMPVGEHGIKVSVAGYKTATDSVKLEQAQQIVTKHWKLEPLPPE